MYKVLSIDGGGVRGLIAARILKEIQDRMDGTPLTKIFDFAVGTSTGGIIALAMGMPDKDGNPKFEAQDMVDLYMNKSSEIFQQKGLGILFAKYSRNNIDKILEEYFGNVELKDTIIPVAVTSYSLTDMGPEIWSTFGAQILDQNLRCTPWNAKIKDLAGATSAAPTFFEPKKFFDSCGKERVEIDGGIYVNNPQIAAFVALENDRLDKIDIDEFVMISIGTGGIIDNKVNLKGGGALQWLMRGTNLIENMMDGNSDLATKFISKFVPNSFRLQVDITKAMSDMDDGSQDNLQDLLNATERYIKDNTALIDRVVAALKGEGLKDDINDAFIMADLDHSHDNLISNNTYAEVN